MKIRYPVLAIALLSAVLAACATLGTVIQPPSFSMAPDQTAEFRLLSPSLQRPLGGATIRIYARVENPNPVGLRIARLAGTLLLEGTPAASVDLPLGLPLAAGQAAIVPLDFSIGFADLPGLADVATRAVTARTINYRLDGIVGVDAGPLGQPSFGPSTWLRGDLNVLR